MSIKKINKKTAGMTLIEILVALGLLALITAPILGVYVMGTRISAASYEATIASYTAQQCMEEFVGLSEEEFSTPAIAARLGFSGRTSFIGGYELSFEKEDNDLTVKSTVTFGDVEIDGIVYPSLARAVVTVYNAGGSVLCSQENLLNITEGGVS